MPGAPAAAALRLQVPEPPAPGPSRPAPGSAHPAPRVPPGETPAREERRPGARLHAGWRASAEHVLAPRGPGVPQPGATARGGDTGSEKRKARGSGGASVHPGPGGLAACTSRSCLARKGDPPPRREALCALTRGCLGRGSFACSPLGFCIPDLSRRVAAFPRAPISAWESAIHPFTGHILINGPLGVRPGFQAPGHCR